MLLKKLAKKRPSLKVILMSATLKADLFCSYFENVPILDIPGRTFSVKTIFLEEILKILKYVIEENSKYTRKIKGKWSDIGSQLEISDAEVTSTQIPKNTILDENLSFPQLLKRYSEYSILTQKNLYVMDPEKINYDLIEQIIEWIIDGNHDYPKEGSILVYVS